LVCCAQAWSTRAIACVLIGTFVVTLGYALWGLGSGQQRWTLVGLCVSFTVLLAALLSVCYFTQWPYRDVLLSRVLLFVAAMNTLFATYDIWEDCVARTVQASDAYRFSSLSRCTTPKCVGIVWLFLSMVMAIAMLGLAIWRSSGGPQLRDMSGISNFSWTCMGLPAGCLVAAAAFRACCSQTYKHRSGLVTRGIGSLQAEEEEDDEEDGAEDPKLGQLGGVSEGSSVSSQGERHGWIVLSTGLHAAPSVDTDVGDDGSYSSSG